MKSVGWFGYTIVGCGFLNAPKTRDVKDAVPYEDKIFLDFVGNAAHSVPFCHPKRSEMIRKDLKIVRLRSQ